MMAGILVTLVIMGVLCGVTIPVMVAVALIVADILQDIGDRLWLVSPADLSHINSILKDDFVDLASLTEPPR